MLGLLNNIDDGKALVACNDLSGFSIALSSKPVSYRTRILISKTYQRLLKALIL